MTGFIVLLCPVDASGTIIIHVHLYMVQPVAGSNAEDVLPTYVESMFRNERYIIAVIAVFILSPVYGFIIGEREL